MAQNLMEAYKKRLTIAESYFAKNHNGQKPDQNRMLVTAQVLKNANQFLGEAFDNSVGTQRADIGSYKKFVMNIDTIVLPSLISHDLVAVVPMSSMTGYVTYMQFVSGSNKGDVVIGDTFNSPFALGKALQKDFTGSFVAEQVDLTGLAKDTEKEITLAWNPVSAIESIGGHKVDGEKIKVVLDDTYRPDKLEVRGVVSYPAENHVFKQTIKITVTDEALVTELGKAGVTVGYVYDNVRIPQEDLPTLDVRMNGIALMAKPRRIAIYFSQMAAFQAKTEYGMDMGAQLAEQAAGVLAYDIDTEAVNLLNKSAKEQSTTFKDKITWNRIIPVGVSKLEHYAGFEEAIYAAAQAIYKRTQKFTANYMVIASNILPIISLCKSFVAAPVTNISGPYMAGTFGGMKVFVSPSLADGEAFFGYKGNGLEAAPAVLGTFMPIVPTQLIQGPDGGSAQGFSSLYDLQLLNPALLVAMEVTGEANSYFAQDMTAETTKFAVSTN